MKKTERNLKFIKADPLCLGFLWKKLIQFGGEYGKSGKVAWKNVEERGLRGIFSLGLSAEGNFGSLKAAQYLIKDG